MKRLKFGCKFPSKWLSFQSQSTPGDLRIFLTFVMGMGAVYGQACDL